MKKCLFFVFTIFHLFSNINIVFVHIGDTPPEYAKTALSQARLFNKEARIIFLASELCRKNFIEHCNKYEIEFCSYQDIPISHIHTKYQKRCTQREAFWRYTSERFLYLWDLIDAYNLDNVFHLENDNMLYADLEKLLPIFQKHYPGIGATFDNDNRCIPGFVWISNRDAMKKCAEYFSKHDTRQYNDMQLMAKFHNSTTKNDIDALPIIMKSYGQAHPLISPHFHKTNKKEIYSQHDDDFNAIFDAAAIGQFLGGIDPIHKNNEPGFINESCLFNPSYLQYEWEKDDEERLVPYAIFGKSKRKIINLHIHSKRLHAFKS